MSCENPISMPNPRYKTAEDRLFWYDYYKVTYDRDIPDEYIKVPCGKCHSCRQANRNGWLIRLMSEYSRYPNSIFITLTFDEQNLKRFRYVPNRAVRLFLDRMRKEFGKQVRHFIIGEYGEKTSRFHYHGILFNIDPTLDAEKLASLWKYGFVFVGYCEEKTIRYILKYLVKIDPKTCKEKKIPRLIVSKGLGENFVEDYVDSPLKKELKPYLITNGKKVLLPRYLKDKMFDADEKAMMQLLRAEQPFEAYVDGVKYNDSIAYDEALKRKFESNVSLGLSEKVERKKIPNTIKPITSHDIRQIEPYDIDFYTKNELEIINSDFSINQTPF